MTITLCLSGAKTKVCNDIYQEEVQTHFSAYLTHLHSITQYYTINGILRI